MTTAIVVAAGEGTRFKNTAATSQAEAKQFFVLREKPLFIYSLQVFSQCESIDQVLLVTTAEKIPRARNLVRRYSVEKLRDVVAGGRTRQGSVFEGLRAVPHEVDTVLIHDAARPLVTKKIVDLVLESLGAADGVVAGVPVTDTVKAVFEGYVQETVDRTGFWLAQTPQVFRRRLLLQAHFKAREDGVVGTDDASLMERMGGKIKIVAGDPLNIKITTYRDLVLADAILERRSKEAGAAL